MTTYRLPDKLGGGEIDADYHWFGSAGAGHEYRMFIEGVGRVALWLDAPLTEVPPPIPVEPEPGPYFIGDKVCMRTERPLPEDLIESECWTVAGHSLAFTWSELWDEFGGPDVDIVPLIPDPAHGITLPAHGVSTTNELVTGRRLVTEVCRNSTALHLMTAEAAKARAAALLAAARTAREGTDHD